jgi:hypothetical protein
MLYMSSSGFIGQDEEALGKHKASLPQFIRVWGSEAGNLGRNFCVMVL